ncbi:MAG: DUF1318 domain-containing protein [Candidatus Omnitrophota bacterium]|nr:DUF1318 domain-containing protein [Candidatus Omnitrophota bacterium]MDZ4242101.1 DUF1318 domain-containing protein [Candidatus Omnitrophota bacterium]
MKTIMTITMIVMLSAISFLSGLVPAAWAASYDIKEMTPEVKAALDSRRERFEQLRALKDQGAIGENNRGYVETLADDAEAKRVASAENKDRRLIYEAIVAQNNLAASELATVEKTFAQVQRGKADAGHKVQDASGNWATK